MGRIPQLFDPGRLMATPGAMEALKRNEQLATSFVSLHLAGRWGALSQHDAQANADALRTGDRILSAYVLRDGQTRIWIITEGINDDGQREATTVLLPDEY